MTEPTGEVTIDATADVQGIGPERVMLATSPAVSYVNSGLTVDAAPVLPTDTTLEQRISHVEVDDYLVLRGRPVDIPPIGVDIRSAVAVGRFTYTDARPQPRSVNTQATARWLPEPQTFTEGASWRAQDGPMEWVADAASSPYLDESYSYDRGDEVNSPAVVFGGNVSMRLNTHSVQVEAFTLALVAVLRTRDGYGTGAEYSIFETDRNGTGEAPRTEFGLRYRHGTLVVWVGADVAEYESLQPLGRPTAMVLTMSADQGRLSVLDNSRATRTFALTTAALFDMDLHFGRDGTDGDSTSTAVMDVLEVDFYDRALDLAETESLLNAFSAIYGISP